MTPKYTHARTSVRARTYEHERTYIPTGSEVHRSMILESDPLGDLTLPLNRALVFMRDTAAEIVI